MKNNILKEIQKILAEQLKISEESILFESHIEKDLGIDSLDKVEFSMNLEEAFDIKISEEELEKFNTILDVVNFLKKKTNS